MRSRLLILWVLGLCIVLRGLFAVGVVFDLYIVIVCVIVVVCLEFRLWFVFMLLLLCVLCGRFFVLVFFVGVF